MTEISEPKTPPISRRDALKVGGLATAGLLLAGASSAVIHERLTLSNEHRINMDNYLSKIKVEGRDEWTVNYTALKLFFPDIVKEADEGNYYLKNDTEEPLVLDFDEAAGKEIRLMPNKTNVALSNMSWEKSQQDVGFGEVSAGLVLEGEFKVKGRIGKPPVFLGYVLDRVITFKGTGNEQCTVEDVAFKGLNAFKQDANGGGDCPSPAFIAADNVNLEVAGVKIDYQVVKPDWANETNSQLAKGVILHNTENLSPIKLEVNQSIIQGMEWDGVCSNGLAQISIDHSRLIQDRAYKQQRGVGVASTFNSPEGNIQIYQSTIDYSKGASIWVNENLDANVVRNLEIIDSLISNSGWAISIDGNQKVLIRNLTISPDWQGTPQQDLTYWPLDLVFKDKKFDLSFKEVNFELTPEIGDYSRLMVQINWDQFKEFAGKNPVDFFQNDVTSWGDISVNIQYPGENKSRYTMTREDFLKTLPEINSDNGIFRH